MKAVPLPLKASRGPPPSPLQQRQIQTAHSGARLVLAQFQDSPLLDFGSVVVGSEHTGVLTLINPSSAAQHVLIDNAATKKGFSVSQDKQLIIDANSSVELTITWCPAEDGKERGTMSFKSGRIRAQVVLLGSACTAPIAVVPKQAQATKVRPPVFLYAYQGADANGILFRMAVFAPGPPEVQVHLPPGGLPAASPGPVLPTGLRGPPRYRPLQ